MIAHNQNLICKRARPYYYDYLCAEGAEPIPPEILDHIGKCRYCRTEANRLKLMVFQTAAGSDSSITQTNSATITNLKLHFAAIGKDVICRTVKPFLPCLLTPALFVKIPTPITTHIDNCPQCSKDLETMSQLGLNRKQSQRLSLSLADKTATDTVSCDQAQPAIPSVIQMNWDGIDANVLKHLCNCPDCRKLLYQQRQDLIETLPEYDQSPDFPCDAVSSNNIFDYCFPYGIDPASDEYAKFRPALTSHLRTCRNCLTRMQQLHNTICGIIERPDSGIVTVYHIDADAASQSADKLHNPYAGFPIRVEVTKIADKADDKPLPATVDFTAALKQKISAMNLKPLLKPGITAAAVILVVFALFLNTPTAKAVALENIYKAIEIIKNVHILSFVPENPEPTQEQWVSRTFKTYLVKLENDLVLWDINSGLRKTKQIGSATVATGPLSEQTITETEAKITGSLGLMPFADLSLVPNNAEWSRVTKESLENIAKNIEVYDLIWIIKAHDGSLLAKKWRVFIDIETNLPERVELYEKLPADSEYVLKSAIVASYLSDSEIKVVLEEAF